MPNKDLRGTGHGMKHALLVIDMQQGSFTDQLRNSTPAGWLTD